MPKFKFKNISNRLINLGTIDGRMLVFNPGTEKELDEELYSLFELRLETAVLGNFLEITEKKKGINFDLNGDGKFDHKDKSIAGKILRTTVGKKTKRIAKEKK